MAMVVVIKKRMPPRRLLLEFVHDHIIVPASLATEDLADAFLGMFKQAIYSERFKADLQPLSEKYLKHKLKESYDPRLFIKTGFFVEHLRVMEEAQSDPRRFVFVVGFPEALEVPGTSLTARQLARILEYGNSRMPARPIFSKVGEMFFTRVLDREGYVRQRILSKIPRASRDFGRFSTSIVRLSSGAYGKKKLRGKPIRF